MSLPSTVKLLRSGTSAAIFFLNISNVYVTSGNESSADAYTLIATELYTPSVKSISIAPVYSVPFTLITLSGFNAAVSRVTLFT